MDVDQLLAESKARFSHNSAKHYLKEKYSSRLIVAAQGGLWRADATTIAFLNASSHDELVLIDTFENPVKVNKTELLNLLEQTYVSVMNEWYTEWKELETKR